jgi:hypothetical protein
VYAVQLTAQASVQRYAAGGSGSVTPSLTITLPGLFNPYSMKTDASGNLYVCGQLNNGTSSGEVLEYLPNTTTPLRTIVVDDVGAVAIDSTGQIYVGGVGTNKLFVYPANSTGTATATRSFSFSPVGGTLLSDMAVDSANNVYLDFPNLSTFNSNVLEFASGATGAPTATRNIAVNGVSLGVAFDASNNLYVSSYPNSTTTSGSVFVYGGAATPTRTVNLAGAGMRVGGVQVDAVGNIYAEVTNVSTSTLTYALVQIGPTQTGATITPVATQTSSAFTSSMGYQIAAF